MADVLEFKRVPDVVMTHIEAPAVCLECRHEWQAAIDIPEGDPAPWLECPGCRTQKGRFKFRFLYDDGNLWHCNCGNNLFQLTREFTYCPACGEK